MEQFSKILQNGGMAENLHSGSLTLPDVSTTEKTRIRPNSEFSHLPAPGAREKLNDERPWERGWYRWIKLFAYSKKIIFR